MATEAAVPTDSAPTPPESPRTSHPTGFWFIVCGEFAERCSYYGMRAILALYMTEKLGVDKANAGTFISLFVAACYFFPLVGGYLADTFFGKYWTIVGFSIPYVIAQFLVGIEDRYVVFGSLVLLAMGSGVIKPNISTLMGLTYNQQRPGQAQLVTSAFSWFYMAINIGAALSQSTMPWLRTKYSYQTAFLFPAALMALALLIFALGKRYYATEKIVRKVGRQGNEPLPADGKTITGLPVTYQAVTPAEAAAEKALRRQTLLRIGSVFFLVMFFWAIFDQASSTWIFFADTYMDTSIFGMTVRADAIQAFNSYFIILLVPVSVWLFKSLERAGWKVKATQKMTLGFAFTGLAMAIMSLSGFLAGTSQKMNKLTLPEGELILPIWKDTKLSDVKKGTEGQLITAGTGVQIAATDFLYDEDKKKLTFTSGTIILEDGAALAIASGHLSAAGKWDAESLTKGGVREVLLKSGEDLAEVKPDAAKATLEVVDWVEPSARVTVAWQILAYLIVTIAEILISVTGLELAFVAAPPSMKGFVTGCWLAVVGLGNLVVNAPFTQMYPLMEPGAYFATLGGTMAIVVVVFQPIAAKFNRGMAAAVDGDGRITEGDTEMV